MTARKDALPYIPLAAVVPCPAGWLVLSAKLQGVTILPEDVFVLDTLAEVVDYRPTFKVITLDAPIGLLDEPTRRGRKADRDAQQLLGWPRRVSLPPAPSRAALWAGSYEKAKVIDEHLTPLTYRRYPWWQQVDTEIQPYRQRQVYAANPELSFYLLNGDQPLRYSKYWSVGYQERLDLVAKRLPGIQKIVEREVRGAERRHALDAAAILWTARRIAAKAVSRLPRDPEWDSTGLRMEWVR